MWYPQDQTPPIEPLPDSYAVRPFSDGDQRAWADLLNRNGQLGRWDLQRIEGEREGALLSDGQFFALCQERVVACAGVYDRQRNKQLCWEIGWIASEPELAGMGLGRQVATAAVRHALALPKRPIYLLTDDHRLAALKTYLRMGFIPDLSHSSYLGRWQRIFSALGDGYEEYRSELKQQVEAQ